MRNNNTSRGTTKPNGAAAQPQSGVTSTESQALQIQRLEARIAELETALSSAPVEVEPGQISLGRLLRAKDETIAAQAELIERQRQLTELWKGKYHESWCTIL